MTIAYVGVGANLDNPLKQVQIAVSNLSTLPQTACLGYSSFYRSKPLGPTDQPDYINAVAAVETTLSPQMLLKALQQLEEKQGRCRGGKRWGPRIIDLDILLYGDLALQSDELCLPHPGLFVREFVLYPLAEVAEDLILPGGESILELKAKCPDRGIERIIKNPSSLLPFPFRGKGLEKEGDTKALA